MKTWFKRKFPDDYLEDVRKQGEENIAFIYTEEIRRAYAHIEKTEALLARAQEVIFEADGNVYELLAQKEWLIDLGKFKGGE